MSGESQDQPSTPPAGSESVQVRHDGHVVATADVSSSADAPGTASVCFQAPHDLPPEVRDELVDQVMEHPAVRGSDTVHVVVPLGDSETIARLQERTTSFTARAAGASSVIEAAVPHPGNEA